MSDTPEIIKRMIADPPSEFESPFHAGLDAGLSGPNTRNTHFKWFQSHESMKEWERGKREATEQNHPR